MGESLIFRVGVHENLEKEEEVGRWGRKAHISTDGDHGDVLRSSKEMFDFEGDVPGHSKRCLLDESI